MTQFRRLVTLLVLWAITSLGYAQNDPDAGIESEILNTSINVFINSGDSIDFATIIETGVGDVDVLITAISRSVDPLFDPDMVVTTLSGKFLAANDDWEVPEGNQQGFIHDVIRCYVQEGVIKPDDLDSVVLLSVTRTLTDGDTRIVAKVNDVDGLAGSTVVSILRVDGALWDTHNCRDI